MIVEREEKQREMSRHDGLRFPVGRIHRHLRKGNYTERVGAGAPVYLAAAMEYLTAKILEWAGFITKTFIKAYRLLR